MGVKQPSLSVPRPIAGLGYARFAQYDMRRQRFGCAGIVLAATLAACSTPAPASSRNSASAAEAVTIGRASESSSTGTTVVGRAPVTDTGTGAIVILEPRHSAAIEKTIEVTGSRIEVDVTRQ